MRTPLIKVLTLNLPLINTSDSVTEILLVFTAGLRLGLYFEMVLLFCPPINHSKILTEVKVHVLNCVILQMDCR